MTERSIESDVGERLRGQERPRRAGHWRAPLAITLIILGCVLAPIAVVGYWAANEVTNTDRYVQNMAPLISEPAIQNALTDKITTVITGQLDVGARTSQVATELSQHGLTRSVHDAERAVRADRGRR